ncbi:hypothetical protein [Bacillus sp. V5-8f]|uniref:hypothetical protein n=1 Tax=Bacillus sp. V5-8f TaxID=2053044 RepID=UPI0015E13586|nr:hypothetical protein [Bacillus sp. V5-8f]
MEPSIKDILELVHLSKYNVAGIGGVYPDATMIQEEKYPLMNKLTLNSSRQ